MNNNVAIIGAGLTGLACALQLAKRNFFVSIFERRSHQEIISSKYEVSGKPGRSMSMDLSSRGIHTLKELDLFEQVLIKSVPMFNKIFHQPNTSNIIIPYDPTHRAGIITISRTELYKILFSSCNEHQNIKIKFNNKFDEIDFSTRTASIFDTKKHHTNHISPKIIIGADGVNSKVRSFLSSHGKIKFNKTTFPHCYKELTIPKIYAKRLERKAMHLWSRSEFMLVAQPNFNGSFTCALILKPTGSINSFQNIDNKQSIRKFFNTHFPDASLLMPELEFEYSRNPVRPLTMLQGLQWTCDKFVLILGDAAHGMVPFFGQGVNCCFEDTTKLGSYLDLHGNNWPRALAEFNKSRILEANAICTMSYENYPELFPHQDLNKIFLEKQLEAYLAKQFGGRFRTYHNLVCFDRVPYSYAQQVKLFQNRLIKNLTKNIQDISQINQLKINQELENYLEKISEL